MFNFGLHFNKSPNIKTSGMSIVPGELKELAEDPSSFFATFVDAENQFIEVLEKLRSHGNVEGNIPEFMEYTKNHKHYISGNLLNTNDKCNEMIDEYDKLVNEINNFKTEKQKPYLIKDIEAFLEKFGTKKEK